MRAFFCVGAWIEPMVKLPKIRLVRILFNAATVLSLLLGVATVVLWVRGRSIGDTFALRRTTGSAVRATTFAQLWSSGGGLRLMIGGMRVDWGASPPVLPPEPRFAHGSYDPGPVPYPIDRSGSGSTARVGGGFEWFGTDTMGTNTGAWARSVTLPAWAAEILLAAAPTFGILRIWRAAIARRRRNENLCPACGYDLRATPERCPECGTAVSSSAVQSKA
jgi:predicted RNA-binding Zn-ribbon protein involved in translation (DUF1610 family)